MILSVMSRLIKILIYSLSLFAGYAVSSPFFALEKGFEECKAIARADMRLECYDRLNLAALLKESEPRFAGKRSVKTEMFTVTEPTKIRYQSDGAIFVLAVHDLAGNVIQNLHLGGRGEDHYILEQPGDYFLRVNGSTTWRIWLESNSVGR